MVGGRCRTERGHVGDSRGVPRADRGLPPPGSCARDATIDTLPLDAVGRVPWWPSDCAEVTLHRVLVHVIAENHRHAGHADIVRELIDGRVGLRLDNDNMAPGDEAWWADHRDRLEKVAQEAGGF